MRKTALVIIVLFMAAGCSHKEVTYKSIPGKEVLNELDSRIFTAFNKPVDVFIQEYGSPESIDSVQVENKHTGAEDYIYTLSYDEYDVNIYHSVEIDKYLLQSVLFKSDEIFNEYNIYFGMAEKDVDVLAPYKVKEEESNGFNEIIYSVGAETGYESLFVFYFKDNSLKQIRYNAPID